jgi:mannose-6-phosphate isomerase-like protein (cupin superfamily)
MALADDADRLPRLVPRAPVQGAAPVAQAVGTIRGKERTMSDIHSKEFVLAGIVMKRLLSGEQTAGQFCLFENKSDGNTRTPIHVHAKDDETVYIIEGELTAVIDGQPRRLTAGESMFLPRGIPHQLMNMSGNPG